MDFVLFIYSAYAVIFIRYVLLNHTTFFSPSEYSVRGTFYEYCDQLFNEKIVFYRNLDAANKAKFVYRVQQFIFSKEWKGIYGFELGSEHRALIAACGVQLTFGLREYTLEHIKRIFVAPEIFYSRLFERDVKGLTMMNAIYLSWDDCLKGIDVNDDAYNLCLHEFAHALDMTNRVDGAETDNHYLNFLQGWDEQSERVFDLMNGDDHYNSFLREYAKVNKHEFFAVCVEHFFEKSQSFKENDNTLFLSLCHLLNLNPLNTTGNYRLEKSWLESECDAYTLAGKYRMSLKWVAIVAGLGFLFSFEFHQYFRSGQSFMLAAGITFLALMAANQGKSFQSHERQLKVAGLYGLGLLPLLYLLLSLLSVIE